MQRDIGKSRPSRWMLIDQPRINTFADVTDDRQFIHIDPERARITPFGSTVAHGFLTLSMLSAMFEDAVSAPKGMDHAVNYGFNKVRFITPVPANSRIRGQFAIQSADMNANHITQILDVSVEIEGVDRPALVAEWINRIYFK